MSRAQNRAKGVVYRKVATELPGDRLSSTYDVLLDGRLMGRVVRRREVTHYRSGPRQVRATTGVHWRYQEMVHTPAIAPGGQDVLSWRDGETWDNARDRATLSLLRGVHGMDIEQVRVALGKPGNWC